MSTGLSVLEKKNKKKSVRSKNNNSKVILFSLLKRLVVNFDNSLNLILPPLKPEKNKICCGKNLSLLLGILKHYYEIICVDFPYYIYMKNDFDFSENVDKFVFISMP